MVVVSPWTTGLRSRERSSTPAGNPYAELESLNSARSEGVYSDELAILAELRRRACNICNLHFVEAARTLSALHHHIPLSKSVHISKLALNARGAAEFVLNDLTSRLA